jgi:hypothetical protein
MIKSSGHVGAGTCAPTGGRESAQRGSPRAERLRMGSDLIEFALCVLALTRRIVDSGVVGGQSANMRACSLLRRQFPRNRSSAGHHQV